MEQSINQSDVTAEQEKIQVLQGIVLPATKLLNSMSQADRVRYAPYLIGGEDSIVKLSVLLCKNLYTPEVIRALVISGNELCAEYLKTSKKLKLRDKCNLSEFKKQVIETNNESLINLLLDNYYLTPWEEANLLRIRCMAHKKGTKDYLMSNYFSKNQISSPARKLLYRPEFAYYWQLYQQHVELNRWDKMKYNLCQNWVSFRYRLGM